MSQDLNRRANLIRSLFVLAVFLCFTGCAASATATPTPASTQIVITVIATNPPTAAALATNTNAIPATTAPTSSPTAPIAPTLTLAPTTAPLPTLAPTQPPASPVPPTAAPLPPTATVIPATATTAPTEPPPQPTQAPTEPPAPVAPTQPPAPPPASFQATELVTVFEGVLRMGSPGGFGYPTDQEPQHDVRIGEFQIERYEVSNAQYAACVAAGICTPPGDRLNADNYPVVNVTWNQADTYCTWVGRRLPNEAEWERAARGMDSWEFSWSNRPAPHFEWNAQFHGSPLSFCEASCPLPHSIDDVNDGFPTSAPVDAFGTLDPRHDISNGFDAQNMNGNVSEWTANWYDGSAYQQGYPVDVFGPSAPTGSKVYRGGSWATEPLRLANRFSLPPDQSRNDLGFRCAR